MHMIVEIFFLFPVLKQAPRKYLTLLPSCLLLAFNSMDELYQCLVYIIH